jgi:hypothetical protein
MALPFLRHSNTMVWTYCRLYKGWPVLGFLPTKKLSHLGLGFSFSFSFLILFFYYYKF